MKLFNNVYTFLTCKWQTKTWHNLHKYGLHFITDFNTEFHTVEKYKFTVVISLHNTCAILAHYEACVKYILRMTVI